MNNPMSPLDNPESQAILDCLRQAVDQALERKRRLGQYAVIWSNDAPVMVGEDAPVQLKAMQDQI